MSRRCGARGSGNQVCSGLRIDTEKSENEPFVRKFPMQVWPTLFIIDPSTERAALKWPGSATASELALLVGHAALDGGSNNEATAAWLRGNRAVGEVHPEVAVRISQGPSSSRPRGQKTAARSSKLT